MSQWLLAGEDQRRGERGRERERARYFAIIFHIVLLSASWHYVFLRKPLSAVRAGYVLPSACCTPAPAGLLHPLCHPSLNVKPTLASRGRRWYIWLCCRLQPLSLPASLHPSSPLCVTRAHSELHTFRHTVSRVSRRCCAAATTTAF